jgi:hypothetical protein
MLGFGQLIVVCSCCVAHALHGCSAAMKQMQASNNAYTCQDNILLQKSMYCLQQ